MAYLADDTFLPSWGSGMRPREPVDASEESSTGLEDYPPKPKKLGMEQAAETQMDQLTAYGTMLEKAMNSRTDKVFARKTRRLSRVRVAEKSLFLLWWPAFLGTCIVAVYSLKYWHHSTLAHMVLALSISIGSGMLLVSCNGGWSGKASTTFMAVNGFCVMFMALVSVILGMYCFHTYTKSYEIYRGSRFYDNIMPNVNPGANRDGGVIKFVEGSHVDVEHSVGIRNGDLYCAAPIIAPDSNSYSGFWAAGVNCCSARGGFHCGDVTNSQVRSGIVVLDENIFGQDEIPEYTKAAEEASAQFGVALPPKPMFVRWSSDVDVDRDQYYHDAMSFVTSSAAGLFCFMLVVVVVLSTSAVGSSDGFAHSYYSVDVEATDHRDADVSRRGKKMKKARHAPDSFVDNL